MTSLSAAGLLLYTHLCRAVGSRSRASLFVQECESWKEDVMAAGTGIEWTELTWNPATGCDRISAGCDHCYAEAFAERWRGIPGHHFEHGSM
jgi:hypothetical protein